MKVTANFGCSRRAAGEHYWASGAGNSMPKSDSNIHIDANVAI
jgi:hypothetical protein